MPLSASDRLEILDLAARYNHAMDAWEAGPWLDCFTEDGELEAGPTFTARGHAELAAMLEGIKARGWPAQHWTNSPVIDGDGDRATMSITLLVLNSGDRNGGGPRVGPLGRYEDELVRVDGAWKFRRRALR